MCGGAAAANLQKHGTTRLPTAFIEQNCDSIRTTILVAPVTNTAKQSYKVCSIIQPVRIKDASSRPETELKSWILELVPTKCPTNYSSGRLKISTCPRAIVQFEEPNDRPHSWRVVRECTHLAFCTAIH